jgi:hypothetical protein
MYYSHGFGALPPFSRFNIKSEIRRGMKLGISGSSSRSAVQHWLDSVVVSSRVHYFVVAFVASFLKRSSPPVKTNCGSSAPPSHIEHYNTQYHEAVMLKFIPTDASKLGQKRKQCQKACDACRRKKKRCSHVDLQRTADSPGSREGSLERLDDRGIDTVFHLPAAGPGNHSRIHETGPSNFEAPSDFNAVEPVTNCLNEIAGLHQSESYNDERSQPDSNDDAEPMLGSRFIGDLNPEGIFLAATSPTATTGADKADRIGIWLTERLSKSHGNSLPHQVESSAFYGFDPLIQKVMIPLLAEECLALLPPQPELEKLRSIYFDKHHQIFPVINENSFRRMDRTEPGSILLQQGMCLVASLNPSAKGYLRLPKASTLLSPREFGRKISAAMRTSIELGLVSNKIIIIQGLALLSFSIDGPNGGDMSSQLCGRAVHYVHSVGLHIQSRSEGQDNQYAESLLCCIWALDRLNAALHGRPALMHERDIGRNLEACFQKQNVCFRLFLRVIALLDNIICLYRPNGDRNLGTSAVFPLFEQLLEETGGSHVPTSLLSKFHFSNISIYNHMLSDPNLVVFY